MLSSEGRARLVAIEPEGGEGERDELEIDMLELLAHVLKKMKVILLIGFLGALLAGVYTFGFVTPQYTATAKLYVLSAGNAVIDLSALQTGTQLAADYKEVFTNWHVHERVIEMLHLPYSYQELSRMISVSNAETARILHIRARSASPEEAKLLADTYAQVAREFIAETMATERPNIFEEALLPAAPSSPNKTRNILAGFLLGALLAAVIAAVRFVADDHIHSEEDIIKYVDLPVLGSMPNQRLKRGAKAQKRPERDERGQT